MGTTMAIGVQNHWTNGIRHGCPLDHGCDDGSVYGDYQREGYNRTDYTWSMTDSWVSIHRQSDNIQVAYASCNYRVRVDAALQTYPYPECAYKTLHNVADGAQLQSHFHYTKAAFC